jgi:ATP-dependent protease ClpP protease subunit
MRSEGIWCAKTLEVKKNEIYKEPSYVETVENRIYFYSDVESENVLQLNKRLRELSHQLTTTATHQEHEPANIFLHVHSYGGSLLAGFAAMDEVVQCQAPVTTIIDGAVASAASFITIVGRHRIIRPHASVLIHQLSSIYWGKYSELKDEMKNLDMYMDMIKSVYKQYTKVPPEELDGILDHDIWFNAQKALEMGIVDEIK